MYFLRANSKVPGQIRHVLTIKYTSVIYGNTIMVHKNSVYAVAVTALYKPVYVFYIIENLRAIRQFCSFCYATQICFLLWSLLPAIICTSVSRKWNCSFILT